MQDQPAHYPIGPSSASRIENCPGSLKLSFGLESSSSKYAEDGTEAHTLAEETITLGTGRVDCKDPSTRQAVQIYVDFVSTILAKNPSEWGVEYKAPHAEIEAFGGTVDFFAVYVESEKRILHIADYKHGVGVFVDHVRNRQMQSYAAIWLSNHPDVRIDVVRMTIVQPRSFECDEPVRTYESKAGEIYAWENKLRSLIGSNFLKAGKHCHWCPAKLVCPEMQKHVLATAQAEFAEGPPEPEKIQDEISWLLELDRLGDTIKTTIEDARRRIDELLRLGVPVPGFKLVEKMGNRQWEDEDKVKDCFDMLGLSPEDYLEVSLVSPAKAEKLLGKKLVNSLAVRPTSKVGVAEAEAPGKPYKPGNEFTVINANTDLEDLF